MARCSTIGPNDSAGKKIRPPPITHLGKQRNELQTICRQGMAELGKVRLAASEPAIASTGTMTKYRPANIASASVRL